MESLRRSMNAPTARAMGVLQKPFFQSEMEDLLAVLPFASQHRRGSIPDSPALPPRRRRPGTGSCIPRARAFQQQL